jgi:uncharacterized SAM-binding protein YcdF (DUF218 family)
MKAKKLFSLGFLVCLAIFLLFTYQTILVQAGKYLAPEKDGKADLVILEGTGSVRMDLVKTGMDFIASGNAKGLVIVVQQGSKEKQPSAVTIPPRLLAEKMVELGIRRDQVKIIEVPSKHPVTLTAAQIVVNGLSRNGVRSAILVSEGFHTRRSYWAYKQAGLPLGIAIFPHPYYLDTQRTAGGPSQAEFTLFSYTFLNISIMLFADMFH